MKQLALSALRTYKKLSPFRRMLMRTFVGQGDFECMYQPTCSEYAEEAVNKYGTGKGIWLATKRLFRCRPGSKGGYDPVP